MADAGFFKGTSAEQDSRFANKQKKLLKQMKFPDNIDVKIDMLKINLDVIKPWITKRLQELLGIEDDVVIEFVFNQLEDKHPDPKMMQINLTGFLGGSKARLFIGELWKLFASAQTSLDGIPAELVEMKKKELLKRQEEDDRLREIRKREEESHRQEMKLDLEKIASKFNGRNQMSTARNENGKPRASYEDNRRETKPRRPERKATRSVSKSSDNDDDRRHHRRQEKPKISSNRRRSPSKSPPHTRSPIKSSRKNSKPQPRSSSASSSASVVIENPPHRSSSNSSVDRSHKKTNNSSVTSKSKPVPAKQTVPSKSKKTKRTRSSSSSSASRSSSNSSASSEIAVKKKKKSPSPNRKRKSDHKSRKPSKSSSRKHHRSNDSKRRSHRDQPEKSKTKRSHRNESSRKKNSKSSDDEIIQTTPPKKPRLESQIKVQTPPRPPPVDDHRVEPQVVPIKPNRTERIVVLEESRPVRIGSIATRVSITTDQGEQHSKNNNSSEDESEIDLRERLLREKAIKSMRIRQSSLTNPTHDRIVYEAQ